MSRPVICIDGYNLALPQGTGVATYGFGLAKTVREMGFGVDGLFGLASGAQPETRELFFFEHFGRGDGYMRKSIRQSIKKWFLAPWRSPKTYEVPQTGLVELRSFANRLPQMDRIFSSPFLFQIAHVHFSTFGSFLEVSIPNPPAIMHWTYPLPVRMKGAKNIYTLHDLVPLRLPYTTGDNKKYYYRLIKSCIEKGDHICTVSDASKGDILSRFPEAAAKTTNTYQVSPVPDEVSSASEAENAAIIATQFGLKYKEFFLFFGAIDPKKNISRILDAYLTANIQTPLVVVASRDLSIKEDRKNPSESDRLFSGKLDPRIRHLEYLPRSTLFRLVQSAKAVLFPSLFEGFGLPALEAIQLGTPVISSNISSLPEVVGDAGVLVDPYKTDQIARAIREIDGDNNLRSSLIQAGPAQVNKFSSEKYQERLSRMYQAVMK